MGSMQEVWMNKCFSGGSVDDAKNAMGSRINAAFTSATKAYAEAEAYIKKATEEHGGVAPTGSADESATKAFCDSLGVTPNEWISS